MRMKYFLFNLLKGSYVNEEHTSTFQTHGVFKISEEEFSLLSPIDFMHLILDYQGDGFNRVEWIVEINKLTYDLNKAIIEFNKHEAKLYNLTLPSPTIPS